MEAVKCIVSEGYDFGFVLKEKCGSKGDKQSCLVVAEQLIFLVFRESNYSRRQQDDIAGVGLWPDSNSRQKTASIPAHIQGQRCRRSKV